MRRVILTLAALLAASGGVAFAPIASAAPEATAAPSIHYSTPVCSENACEQIVNAAQGSDYIYYVMVWDRPNPGLLATYRLLFDRHVRYTEYGYGAAAFNLDYYVDHGKCIQGGIPGLPDARTPCWYAP